MGMRILGFIAVFVTGALLTYGVADFPKWGDPHSPANAGEVSTYFIQNTKADTHVPNIVTAVLADYRGYDTMFETVVIFIAGVAIMAILRVLATIPPGHQPVQYDPRKKIAYDPIISVTCRLIVPVIQLFALYVVAHGHHSPGGGFQGGVILGASFILIAITSNLRSALRRFSEKRFIFIACAGALIYSGFGLTTLLFGRNFLDYGVLSKIMFDTDEVMARSHSMLGVEIGVMLTVTAIMFAIYANLSSRGALRGGL